MSNFIIKNDFWKLFPKAEIGVVVAKKIDNKGETPQEIKDELEKVNKEAVKFLNAEVFSENPVISVWRDAYKKFKTKKGARASIENLLKRAEKGNSVRSINPLVDLYNIISLKYALPCGGEDIDSFEGDLLLTTADGGESFISLGETTEDNALEGEVVYKDDKGIVCRCWNYRESARTILTEDTKNAFLIIESVDEVRGEDLKNATEELAYLVDKYLGGDIETFYLNINKVKIEL